MAILYALVARGKAVLAEHTSTSGNFPTVTRVLLGKISDADARMSYKYDAHMFHYLVSDGITFLCMSDDEDSRRVPFAFLEQIRQQFMGRYSEAAIASAIAFSLNEDFSPTLQQQMEFYNTDAGADNLATVRSKIDDVKSVMVENIDKVLERGEKIELLVDKTDQLNQQAFKFEKSSRRLQQSMLWKRVKVYLLIAVVLGVVVYIIAAMACGGMNMPDC